MKNVFVFTKKIARAMVGKKVLVKSSVKGKMVTRRGAMII